MKMNKKKTLVVSLAVAMIAILSLGTLAWFNDSDTATNKFYVATSDEENVKPDDIFSVDVYEKIDTDGDGIPDLEEDELKNKDTDGDGIPDIEEDENGNGIPDIYEDLDKDGIIDGAEDNDGDGIPDYGIDTDGHYFENIVPGDNLVKEPFVKNTGRHDMWVRLTLTFSSQDAWYKLMAGKTPLDLLTFADGFDEMWVGGSYTATGDEYVYVYYSKAPLTPGETLNTITHVNIPGKLTQQDLVAVGEVSLDVKAEAVQVENLAATTAKAAFTEVGWEAGTNYGE